MNAVIRMIVPMLLMFVFGWVCAIAAQVSVFKPWLDSIKVGDPDFALRMRDYSVMWNSVIRASRIPFMKACYCTETSFAESPKAYRDRGYE